MSTKILLAALTLLAVANATDVHMAHWTGSDVGSYPSTAALCPGNPQSSIKVTLGLCTQESPRVDPTGSAYFVLTGTVDNSGITRYAYKTYSNSDCSDLFWTQGFSATAIMADTCVWGAHGSMKVLSASAHLTTSPSAVSTSDCTSGACGGYSVHNVAGGYSGYTRYMAEWTSTTQCTLNAQTSSKVTIGKCTRVPSNINYVDSYQPSYSFKLTLKGSTYTYQSWSTSVRTGPDCSGTPESSWTTTSDSCQGTLGSENSFKVLSGAAYLSSAASTFDCTSGYCVSSNTLAPTNVGDTLAPSTAPEVQSGENENSVQGTVASSACRVAVGAMAILIGLAANLIA